MEKTVGVPFLGAVRAYCPASLARARGVVLFLSGDGGWNLGVVDMARRIAPWAVVLGIPLPAYRRLAEKEPGRCWYPAGELEAVARAAEKALGFPRYLEPVLAGYSSGATLAYGVLAQAPAETFAGAVSLGFCPDLDVARPLCGREGWRPRYDPKKRTSLLPPRADLGKGPGGAPRWIVLQGTVDQVCAPESTARFVRDIPGAKIVSLPKVGHGFSVPRNWAGAFDEAVGELLREAMEPGAERASPGFSSPAEGAAASLERRLQRLDLPLEVLWPAEPRRVLVFVSGDGGWAEIDRAVAARLGASRTAVVGWNALRYFWQEKTPERFLADLARLLDALPQTAPVFAGGYSFGAEVLAVSFRGGWASGLPALRRIRGLVLLAPGPYASFEVSPLDWFRRGSKPTGFCVSDAVERAPLPVLCLEPSGDRETGCPAGAAPHVERARVAGGHHFGGDFDGVAARMLAFMEAREENTTR